MNDQLARKYDYYTINPEPQPEVTIKPIRRKKGPTKKQKLAMKKAQQKKLARKRAISFVFIMGIILLTGLYTFFVNGLL